MFGANAIALAVAENFVRRRALRQVVHSLFSFVAAKGKMLREYPRGVRESERAFCLPVVDCTFGASSFVSTILMVLPFILMLYACLPMCCPCGPFRCE